MLHSASADPGWQAAALPRGIMHVVCCVGIADVFSLCSPSMYTCEHRLNASTMQKMRTRLPAMVLLSSHALGFANALSSSP